MDPSRLFHGVLGGEVGPALQALPHLEAGDARTRAWSLAIRAAGWHADAARFVLPTAEELSAARAAGEPAGRCAVMLARAALLTGALEDAEAWLGHAAAADGEGEPMPDVLVAEAWLALLRDRDATATARRAHELASRAEDAASVVEAVALRAWSQADHGSLDDALGDARKASRMARTEGIPGAEYLANRVLARVRRLRGYPHLAARILRALMAVAPAVWRPSLQWEMALAGAEEGGAGTHGAAPAGRAADLVCGLVGTVRDGDRRRFEEHARELVQTTAALPLQLAEARVLCAALDPLAPVADAGLPPDLAAWLEGREHGLCPMLSGWNAWAPEALRGVGGVAVARPGAAPRRALAAGARWMHDARVVPASQRRRDRVTTLLAVLTLAGEPLRREVAFKATYGFPFVHDVHNGAFRVVLHRARESVAGAATIEADEDHLQLVAAAPLVVPDPRTAPAFDEGLLVRLASQGPATAREAASLFNIPLRTTQAALRALAEEGALQRERKGRDVRYTVEDTTFQEPTRPEHGTGNGRSA